MPEASPALVEEMLELVAQNDIAGAALFAGEEDLLLILWLEQGKWLILLWTYCALVLLVRFCLAAPATCGT